jgi:hypothetical protein
MCQKALEMEIPDDFDEKLLIPVVLIYMRKVNSQLPVGDPDNTPKTDTDLTLQEITNVYIRALYESYE